MQYSAEEAEQMGGQYEQKIMSGTAGVLVVEHIAAGLVANITKSLVR